MILNLNIDQESFEIEIKPELVKELLPVIAEMDKEYLKGIQMGRYWVEKPSDEERCQLVADKISGAFHREDKRTLYTMSAYIVFKFPEVKSITVSSEHEMQDIDIHI